MDATVKRAGCLAQARQFLRLTRKPRSVMHDVMASPDPQNESPVTSMMAAPADSGPPPGQRFCTPMICRVYALLACPLGGAWAVFTGAAERRCLLTEALSGPLAGHLSALTTNAGLHIATLLQKELGEDEVIQAAAEHGIGTMGLQHFFHASPPQPGLLLGFGAIRTTDLPAALRALGGIFAAKPR